MRVFKAFQVCRILLLGDACQHLLHHAWGPQQGEYEGAKQVATCCQSFQNILITRRTIRVSKVIVHEEFSHTINDIALLQLGKKYPLTQNQH